MWRQLGAAQCLTITCLTHRNVTKGNMACCTTMRCTTSGSVHTAGGANADVTFRDPSEGVFVAPAPPVTFGRPGRRPPLVHHWRASVTAQIIGRRPAVVCGRGDVCVSPSVGMGTDDGDSVRGQCATVGYACKTCTSWALEFVELYTSKIEIVFYRSLSLSLGQDSHN